MLFILWKRNWAHALNKLIFAAFQVCRNLVIVVFDHDAQLMIYYINFKKCFGFRIVSNNLINCEIWGFHNSEDLNCVFWVMMPCSLVCSYYHSGFLSIATVSSSKMLVTTYKTVHYTEHLSQVVITPASYSGGNRLNFWPRGWLSDWYFLWFSSVAAGRC